VISKPPTTRAIALSLALTAFLLIVTPNAVERDAGVNPLDALAYVLLVGAGLSFALRSQPYASYALALGCVTAYVLRDYGGGPI